MIFKSKGNEELKENISSEDSSKEQNLDKKNLFGLFSKLPPKHQRLLRFGVIILGIIFISYLTVISTPSKKETKKEPTPAEKKKFSLLTEKVDKDLWLSAEGESVAQLKKQVETFEGKLNALTKSIEDLREDLKKKEQIFSAAQQKGGIDKKAETKKPSGFPPIPPELNPFVIGDSKGQQHPSQQFPPLKEPQGAVNRQQSGELPPPVPSSIQPTTGMQAKPPKTSEKAEDKKKFRIFENELKEEKSKDSAKKDKKEQYKTVWVPAGTMLRATLLTGMDAPTDVGSAKEPLPVVMLVSDVALMPNQFGLDLRQCIIIGSGWGNLADERAYIRTETLSCITRDGKAFEIGLKGHVYSTEDGKSGLRGRYVSKQGQQIAMALLAGVLSSVGQSLTSLQGNVVNVYTDDNNNRNRRLSFGSALGAAVEQSVFSGVGSATRSVADFYLKLADKMYPVIEVDAGRKVEILVLKGQEIKIKQN